jgi:kexin
MHLHHALAAALAVAGVASAGRTAPSKRDYANNDYYVIELDARAGLHPADAAAALGVRLVERAGELPDHYLVMTPKSTAATVAQKRSNGRQEEEDPVHAALVRLRKRASSTSIWSLSSRSTIEHAKRVSAAVRYLEKQVPRQRVKRASPPVPSEFNASSSAEVAKHFDIQDPLFEKQWHLVNEEFPEHSMNVSGVWEMGITGEGIISALVDDGLDYTSDDLAGNFVSL